MKAARTSIWLSALVAAMCMSAGAAHAQSSPKNDTNPEWLKKPTPENLLAVYPSKALKEGLSGTAIVKCIVQTNGLVRACSVTKEDRPGMGFGPAAVALSSTFLFKPATRDGHPVEAEVVVPINFKTFGKSDDSGSIASDSGGASRIPSSTPTATTVLSVAVWSKTPTISRILSEIDKKVGDKFADGQVVLQCRLDKKTGKLSGCIVANASPGMAQFSNVARALTSDFQADPKELEDIKANMIINLAFAFPDMSSPQWSKRYVTHPLWIRTISPDPNQPLFPEDAAKAGLKTGSATVDCVLATSGALTNCGVVSESNPNVGFGELAKKIAEVFVANPWTEDGLPADGAHVRMPIRMDYVPPAEAAPSSAAPILAPKP